MHCLTNFKNFAEARLNLFSPLTILLGRNGSGKTNLIEGVELFAALVGGTPLNEISDVARGGSFEIRGGLGGCIRFGEKKTRLRFHHATIQFHGRPEPVDYSIDLSVFGRNQVQLAAEKLTIGNQTLIAAEHDGGELLTVSYANFSPGRNPHVQLPATRSVLSRFEEITRSSSAKGSKLKPAIRTVENVRTYLQRSFIFDPQPQKMRDYVRGESNPQLFRNGANLSAVLLALRDGSEEQQATLQRITATIRQIPEEPFETIDFVETALGDVMAAFARKDTHAANGKLLLDARILSDGTLRMLAIITALETVPEGSRIVIEEFDNGLHPSRANLLVQTLEEAGARRNLNILLTTHNPAFMDALGESHMDSVLISHHDETLGGFKVTPLSELDIAGTLSLQGGLGDFVTRGGLDQHLRPDFQQERAQNLKQWLSSLS